MASSDELKNAKRLQNLDVREVSMVDKPAILREFLVIKRRQQEDSMGAFANSTDPSVIGLTIEKASAPSGDAEDTNKATLTEEEAKKVADFIKKAAAEPGSDEALKKVAAMLDGEVKKKEDEEATKAKKAAGGEDEDTAKAKKAADGEDEDTAKRKQMDDEEGVKKSADPILQLNADGSVLMAGNIVQKAKGFTQNRTEQLRAAASALMGLMKDVDEDAMKSIVSDFAKGEFPTGAKVDSQVRPTGVMKSDDSDPRDAQIAELTKRLEAIEKTRGPSKSVEGEGGTDQQVSKSFWGGVL
jgi:hypothetical protein